MCFVLIDIEEILLGSCSIINNIVFLIIKLVGADFRKHKRRKNYFTLYMVLNHGFLTNHDHFPTTLKPL